MIVVEQSQTVLHSTAVAVVASGVSVFTNIGTKEVDLSINVKAVAGAAPSIVYEIQEVDPVDGITPIGTAVTGAALTGVGVQQLSLHATTTGTVLVTWTVTGAGTSINVNATLSVKQSLAVTSSVPPIAASSAATQFGTTNLPNYLVQAKASAGIIRSVFACNRNANIRYLGVFNAANGVPNIANLILSYVPIPAGGGAVILDEGFFSQFGVFLSVGILIAISTSRTGAFAAATADDHDISGVFT